RVPRPRLPPFHDDLPEPPPKHGEALYQWVPFSRLIGSIFDPSGQADTLLPGKPPLLIQNIEDTPGHRPLQEGARNQSQGNVPCVGPPGKTPNVAPHPALNPPVPSMQFCLPAQKHSL